MPNISDVEFAVLETNGQLSVFPKAQKRPTIPEDFHLTAQYEGLPLTLIMDGRLNSKNLEQGNKDLPWLKRELKKHKISQIEDVFLASLDSSGTLFVQAKRHASKQKGGGRGSS